MTGRRVWLRAPSRLSIAAEAPFRDRADAGRFTRFSVPDLDAKAGARRS